MSERGIDALVADPGMRRRDERLAGQDKHKAKPDPLHDKSRKAPKRKHFAASDFAVADDQSHAVCPAGQRLYRNGRDCALRGGYRAVKFRAPVRACAGCALREQCLRKPDSTPSRQMAILTRKQQLTHSERMRQRLDSDEGRELYGRRLGIIEPDFGNVRHNESLARSTLRGRTKIDGQWKLFALVHNIGKLANHRKAA